MKGVDYMGKIEINARGLNSAEIQSAIDSTVDFRKKSVAESKEGVKKSLIEYIGLDSDFALVAIEAIQHHHPELLKDKIISKDAVYSVDDFVPIQEA